MSLVLCNFASRRTQPYYLSSHRRSLAYTFCCHWFRLSSSSGLPLDQKKPTTTTRQLGIFLLTTHFIHLRYWKNQMSNAYSSRLHPTKKQYASRRIRIVWKLLLAGDNDVKGERTRILSYIFRSATVAIPHPHIIYSTLPTCGSALTTRTLISRFVLFFRKATTPDSPGTGDGRTQKQDLTRAARRRRFLRG